MKGNLSCGTRARLGVERLEQKQLLAGDVVVNILHGNLLIEGDAEANQIAITSGPDAGSYLIRGLDGTTVHLADGDPADTPETGLVVTGVTRNVRISMGDGDDVVRIQAASFAHNVGIGTGEGEDRVLIGLPPENAEADPAIDPTVSVRGSLTIATGAAADVVRVAQANVGGPLSVWTDGGADRVVLGADPETSAAATETAEGVAEGADAEASHLLRVRGGIHVALGEGDDALSIVDAGSRRGVAVDGGLDGDRILLRDVDAGFSLWALGGRGDSEDNITLEDVSARIAVVATGDGADHVRIADSAFAALTVSTGGGDDTIDVAGTKARVAAFLGGEGTDALNEGEGNEFGTKIVRNIEVPEGANTEASLKLGQIVRQILKGRK